MGLFLGQAADLTVMAVIVIAQWYMGRAILERAAKAGWSVVWVKRGLIACACWIVGSILLSFSTIANMVPLSYKVSGALRAVAFYWSFGSTAGWVIYHALRRIRFWPEPEKDRTELQGAEIALLDPARRRWLLTAGRTAVASPFAVISWGTFIERTNFKVREIDIPIENLPADLEGLRIVQISDVHMSAYLSEKEFAGVVDAANELRPHLTVITGDLISMRGDPLDACLGQMARLRADAGLIGCLGNHEVYARAEAYTVAQGARLGIPFLRSQTRQLRFGQSTLNIAGIDYQRMRSRYLVGAEKMLVPGAINVLLSHNPDVFRVAASQGWDLTLAGHTHGGQVNVEILSESINVARFYTSFVYGLYRDGRSSIYVTRGIGTIALPARLGAPPETALIRLRKA